MKIAGFKKQSFIDFPGNISSVVFTQGCNFRCGYCHNPELVLPEQYGKCYNTQKIISYISKHKHLLDAVCITGGEPTMQEDLLEFAYFIKQLGLLVKLDTNGSNPQVISDMLQEKLVDCIAMDIKHVLEFDAYNYIVGGCINEKMFSNICETIEIIQNSKIEFEFRTTVICNLHAENHIKLLKNRFKSNYTIHNFVANKILDNNAGFKPFSSVEFEELLKI